jgi:hypothetical protein
MPAGSHAAGLSTSGGLTAWLRDIVGREFKSLIEAAAQTPPGAGLVASCSTTAGAAPSS